MTSPSSSTETAFFPSGQDAAARPAPEPVLPDASAPVPAAQAAGFQPSMLDRFAAFIDRGEKTTATYVTNLRQFLAWMRFAGVVRPAREDVVRYREYLCTEHAAIRLAPEDPAGWAYRTDSRRTVRCRPATVAQYLRSVCQFFRWTAAEGLYPNIADNIHAPRVRTDAHKKEALTPPDVLAIEKSILAAGAEKAQAAVHAAKDAAGRAARAEEQGRRLHAMYLLAVNAGLRTIELERADVKDLEVRNGRACLYVWGKGRTEADSRKPLAPEVYAAVQDYLSCRSIGHAPDTPLFAATGNRSGGRRMAARTIGRMLKKAMQQAGYDSERITAHSLRHTAGTCIMELSGDLFTTQRYMRHRNPATTEIYLHNDTEKQEAQLAQELYNFYHGLDAADGRSRLEALLAGFSPAQIERLAGIAEAMKG